MSRIIRRVALIVATSSGVITASTLTANAGLHINHCAARLPR